MDGNRIGIFCRYQWCPSAATEVSVLQSLSLALLRCLRKQKQPGLVTHHKQHEAGITLPRFLPALFGSDPTLLTLSHLCVLARLLANLSRSFYSICPLDKKKKKKKNGAGSGNFFPLSGRKTDLDGGEKRNAEEKQQLSSFWWHSFSGSDWGERTRTKLSPAPSAEPHEQPRLTSCLFQDWQTLAFHETCFVQWTRGDELTETNRKENKRVKWILMLEEQTRCACKKMSKLINWLICSFTSLIVSSLRLVRARSVRSAVMLQSVKADP